ncbi:MAG: hypothetical protein RLZZ450_7236 [Pseudomonadota bacterium]
MPPTVHALDSADDVSAQREVRPQAPAATTAEPGHDPGASPLRTLMSTFSGSSTSGGKTGRTRLAGPFGFARDVLLMAVGRDDDDDYECGHG